MLIEVPEPFDPSFVEVRDARTRSPNWGDERRRAATYGACMLPPTLGDPAGLREEHLEEWRDASKRVMRTYNAWCAASRRDRHVRYVSFLNALRHEARAAEQLEGDALAPGGADGTPRRKGQR